MSEKSRHLVVTFNCGDYVDHFVDCESLPVEFRHLKFDVPWQEIAARRARDVSGVDEVSTEIGAALKEAEVVFAFAPPRGLTQLSPNLRWIETPATGFDQLNGTGALESKDVIVTTVGGLFAGVVAEHAFALLLSLTRRLSEFRDLQRRAEWQSLPVRELNGMTLGIVGLGNIGSAVARTAKTFGMRVLAARRIIGDHQADVDAQFTMTQLTDMLPQADVVVVCVAGTAETTNLINAAEIAAMKTGALLVNVARGMVINEPAMVEALSSGHLAGAGLDVFVREPLPPYNPLWKLPNVILTPHVAITTPTRMPRAIAHFTANLARHCTGQPLVDVAQG